MKIDSVRLTRLPTTDSGGRFEAVVTVENTSSAPMYVASHIQDWDYDATSKTLTLDFTDTPHPIPKSTSEKVSTALPKRNFPLNAEVVAIRPHSKATLTGTRAVVTSHHRLLEDGSFATDETDVSLVERVTVRIPIDATRFERGETEDVERARARFRAWGKRIEKSFEVKLR